MALTANQVQQVVETLIHDRNDKNAEQKLSEYVEYLAGALFRIHYRQGLWCDGFILESVKKQKPHQLKISGIMWVAQGGRNQWQEPADVWVTDRRVTKQGIYLKMKVADWEGDGLLDDLINNL